MSELTSNQYLIIIAVLVFISIVMLFLLSRSKRDTQELQQDLNKTIDVYNQLAERFDSLSVVKNQLEQQAVKVQTHAEGLQTRLNERDEKIQYLEKELDEEQLRHDQIGGQITALKERFGIASAQAESLQGQLQQAQENVLRKEQEQQKMQEKLTALSQELTELKTTLSEKEKHFAEQQQHIEQSKQQLGVEFQNLANRILEEKSQSFNQTNQTALETLLKPFREQIEGQLERALQLAGLIENVHYSAQAHFKDEQGGRNYPDFVLNLPDEKNIIIDSKMSLNAYESAVNSEDEFERERLLREHIKALKNHIDDLHRKDYSNLIGMRSPNFVLMFIAVEPAYIEALKLDPSLFNYGYEKNVIMVSHTTLMPILRTVANLWRIERGNAEAKEIAEKAGEIYNQICLVAERLSKLGNTLSTVSNQYNSTVTALVGQQGLVGKVERFKDLSAKANKSMPNVELLNNDVDLTRLSLITTENGVK